MLHTLRSSPLHRLLHTPLRDLIRGRLTGRLDIRGHIDAADLPVPAKALIWRIVRRTRLWPLEKVDVASELIAHFADGLDSGTPMDQLLNSFGNERQAARLIRRAKKRNRPLLWHIWRGFGWLLVAVCFVYGVLALRFWVGKPSPSIDYLALFNQPDLSVGRDQWAWPLYRQALLGFGDEMFRSEQWKRLGDARPGNADWPEMVAWLHDHQSSLELIRRASEKPVLGFILGPGGSADDPQLWPSSNSTPTKQAAESVDIFTILLPHLNEMRLMAFFLMADAADAAENANGALALRDILAAENLARQLTGHDLLITDLVAQGIRAAALARTQWILQQYPQSLSEAQWRDLAHYLSRLQIAADLFHLRGERWGIYDLIQRVYTDDGNGHGRITPDGVLLLYHWRNSMDPVSIYFARLWVAAPVLAASRQEVVHVYDQWMNATEAALQLPRRQAESKWQALLRQVTQLKSSPIEHLRYALLVQMMPSFLRLQASAQRYFGQRDGTLVAIALELYHRRHGEYPATLQPLAPAYLPEIPTDRITGDPIHYRLIDGRPVIYSLGNDRDDDHGRATAKKYGWEYDPPQDGDRVLYPSPELMPDPETE